jgi:phospholipase C
MIETRREFIKKAALLSGAAGFLGGLPESIQRALAITPEPGTTFLDAEHIVILMQENRSFDHAYGTMRGVRGFNDPRAITLSNGNPVWLQTDATGTTYTPFRLNIKETKATWMGSLPHSWTNQVDARNGGKHDKWLDAKRSGEKAYASMPLTMGFYNRDDIPFYYALADAFTVCDQHFCSSLTGTMPNRLYFWTGTIRGDAPNAPAKVLNDDVEYEDSAHWKTLPERLEENNVSWKIYQNELYLDVGFTDEEAPWLSNFGDNPLEWYTQYHARFLPSHRKFLDDSFTKLTAELDELRKKSQDATLNVADSEKIKSDLVKAEDRMAALVERRKKWSAENFEKLSDLEKSIHAKAFCTNVADPSYHELTTLSYRDGETHRDIKIPKGDVLQQFRDDVNSGKLPTVSWLVAPENFSDHPSSAWFGAWYVSEVMDILTRNPAVWKKTIFILTYDENDGYFDHVPPFVPPDPRNPATGMTSPGAFAASEFVTMEEELARKPAKNCRESPIGLGYRVPLVIASPWSRGGFVCSQVFDHTSVPQFLETFVTKKFAPLKEDNITAWRRAVCGDLTSSFRPYAGEAVPLPEFLLRESFVTDIHKAQFVPIPANYKALQPGEIEQIRNGFRSPLVRQEPGVRPACALPYELHVDGKWNRDKRAFEIVFSAGKELFGEKSAGAPFQVYAGRRYPALPSKASSESSWDEMRTWSFAAAAGESVEYSWPLDEFEGGIFHLQIHGPNGFHREFKGSSETPAIAIRCEAQQRQGQPTGRVNLTIDGAMIHETVPIEIRDLSYKHGKISHALKAGTSRQIEIATTSGWYDFAVRFGKSGAEYRYAGRIETGKTSITDPLMGNPA